MEELYNIPASWIWSNIESIGKAYSGGTPKTSDESNFDGDIPWITPADLTGYKAQYISQGRRNLSAKGLGSCSAKLMPKDTVLFSSRAPIGYVAIASNPVSTNQGFKSISPHQGIDSRYVYFYLKSAKDLAESRASGTTFKELSGSRFNQLPIPIAPSSEQVRIVDRIEQLFSDLDEGEALLKTVQKQLATYRQSVLKAAVTGELIGAKVNKWKEYSVGQLLTDIRYGTAKKCAFDPKKTPVLRIPNVAGGKIDLTDLKHTDFTEAELKKLSLEAGDVLIVRSNGSVSLVGLSAIVTDSAVGFAYAGYLIRLRLKKDIILPEFLNLYLHSPIVRNKIELQARSTSGVHNVNSDEIKAIALKVPSIKEQELIVDKVEECFSQIAALEDWCIAGLKRSNTLRQSILKSAFSGELVAQDPADEPASELLARIKSGNKQVVKSKQKLKAATSRGGGKPRSDKTEVA